MCYRSELPESCVFPIYFIAVLALYCSEIWVVTSSPTMRALYALSSVSILIHNALNAFDAPLPAFATSCFCPPLPDAAARNNIIGDCFFHGQGRAGNATAVPRPVWLLLAVTEQVRWDQSWFEIDTRIVQKSQLLPVRTATSRAGRRGSNVSPGKGSSQSLEIFREAAQIAWMDGLSGSE